MSSCVFFLIGFFNSAQAEQPFNNESNFETDLKAAISRASQSPSILSTFLYLPLIDNDGLSSIMSQNQMTVTPSQTYLNITGIYVRQHNTINGTCLDTAFSSYGISGAAVTLQQGHTYATTDASNFALLGVYSSFDPSKDIEFGLANAGGLIANTLICIQGGGTCTNSTNCGWSSAKTWTPPT